MTELEPGIQPRLDTAELNPSHAGSELLSAENLVGWAIVAAGAAAVVGAGVLMYRLVRR